VGIINTMYFGPKYLTMLQSGPDRSSLPHNLAQL